MAFAHPICEVTMLKGTGVDRMSVMLNEAVPVRELLKANMSIDMQSMGMPQAELSWSVGGIGTIVEAMVVPIFLQASFANTVANEM